MTSPPDLTSPAPNGEATPWLEPWCAARVLHVDSRVLVVDKPSGLPVHGGNVELAEDVVTRLGAWLQARGELSYLAVHQRLDQGTSGVLFLLRDAELNKAVAEEMEAHRSERRYLAVVSGTSPILGKRGSQVFEDRLLTRKAHGQLRVEVSSRGKPARTRCKVLKRVGERALLELCPETGRTHQLRVQLASRGLPILGDTLYGGAPASRLLLHCQRLGLASLDLQAEAPMPELFSEALSEPPTGPTEASFTAIPRGNELARCLDDALSRRWPLRDTCDVLRLVHEYGDGLPGLSADAYGKWVALSIYTPEALEQAPFIAEHLLERGFAGVYLKQRVRADLRRADQQALAPNEVFRGEPTPAELQVREGQLKFLVDLQDGLSTGLFVDQRDNRARVLGSARSLRVLNLFSYTCSFSVAAAVGGARETISVDLSGRYLAWGEKNLALNGVAGPDQRLLKADAADYLRRAIKREERFELIILDPPSFGSHGKKSFSIQRDYKALAADALRLLTPGGRLLAVTNHRKTSPERFQRWLEEAALDARCKLESLRPSPTPHDCPAWPTFANGPRGAHATQSVGPTKAVWLTRR